jgi:hypothetical protein
MLDHHRLEIKKNCTNLLVVLVSEEVGLVVGVTEEVVDPLVVVQLVEVEVSEEEPVADTEGVELDPLVVTPADDEVLDSLLVEDEVLLLLDAEDVGLLVGVTEVLLLLDAEDVGLLVGVTEVLLLLLDAEDVGLLVDATEVLDTLVLLWLVEVGETVELDWLGVGSDGVPVPQ